jgi:hypothetical protein
MILIYRSARNGIYVDDDMNEEDIAYIEEEGLQELEDMAQCSPVKRNCPPVL